MTTQLPRLLFDLAAVLGVAAVTSLVCRRLRLPAVLGYLVAGLIVGPHVPIPLVADLGNVQALADLGVLLLMFSVGLEFAPNKLVEKGPAAMAMGVCQLGCSVWLTIMAGRALGWTLAESALTGAALSISSTMIIAKLFEEYGGRGHLRDRVLTVLVVQDLAAILLLAGLGVAGHGGGPGNASLGAALARLILVPAGLLGVGGLVVPRLLRWAADRGREETLLVASVGACFAATAAAAAAGCSPAMGAFLAGMLASASGRVARIEHLVMPLRDIFAAIFFVAVGMLLDPRSLAIHAGPILVLSAAVLLASCLGGTLGGALAGQPLRAGFRTGMSLAQPGEFSFLLVGTGVHSGLLGPDFLSIAVGVCLVTALLGPTLFRRGDALAAALERRLPERLNWYLKAYQSWAARLGRFSLGQGPAPLRRPLLFLVLDAGLVNLVLAGAALVQRQFTWFRPPRPALGLLAVQAGLVALLAWALYRRAMEIAERIVVGSRGAPMPGRRHLQAALGLALLLLAGAPSLVLLQPFLPEWPLLALFLVGLTGLAGQLWAHARRFPPIRPVGSEWLLDQVQAPWARNRDQDEAGAHPAMASIRLASRCPYLGRTLADLPLKELTGAEILGLVRQGKPLPLAPELALQAEDLLALCGPPDALERARQLLG
jgi:CPA2 family monovalent cation:H+ antiporter-2